LEIASIAPVWLFLLGVSPSPSLGIPRTMMHALLHGRLRNVCVARVIYLRMSLFCGCCRNGRMSLLLCIAQSH
jgi:hypothetical protein